MRTPNKHDFDAWERRVVSQGKLSVEDAHNWRVMLEHEAGYGGIVTSADECGKVKEEGNGKA